MKACFLAVGLVLVGVALWTEACNSNPTTPSPTPVAVVRILPDSATLAIAGTMQLTATPLDAGGNALPGRAITWQSHDDTIATVSGDGLVAGVAVGRATITATSEGKQGRATIAVVQQPIVGWLEVVRPSSELTPGATVQFSAWFFDNSGNRLPDRPATWSSNNSSVATVEPATGLVTGVAVGTAFIYAAAPGFAGDHQGVSVFVMTGVTETDLGDLGGGAAQANGISNGGVVVGVSATASHDGHAFTWSASQGMVDLGTLGGAVSAAFAINDGGQVVGVSATASGAQHAFVWSAARGMQDLGVFPGGVQSIATAINGTGEVVGSADGRAARWSATGGIQGLGPPGSADSTVVATGINDAGQLVGWGLTTAEGCSTSGCVVEPGLGPPFAFTWTAGGGLVGVGVNDPSHAFAINSRGDIVGDVVGGAAYLKPATGPVQSLALLPAGSGAQANAVNTSDQAAGAASAGSGVWHPVFWRDAGQVVLLSISYGSASGVNDLQQIAGTVTDNGRQRAKLWTLSSTSATKPRAGAAISRRRVP